MHSGNFSRLNVEHFMPANLVCMLLSANSLFMRKWEEGWRVSALFGELIMADST
jgi:hypothetical protein